MIKNLVTDFGNFRWQNCLWKWKQLSLSYKVLKKKRIQATRTWDKGQLGRQDLEPKRKKWQFKIQIHQAFPGGLDGEESACSVADWSLMTPGSSLEGPLEKGMATHSSILAWKSHGQRSLAGYSPCSRKEMDTTEPQTHTHNRSNTRIIENLQLGLEIGTTV